MALAARRRAAEQEARIAQKIGEGRHISSAASHPSTQVAPDEAVVARAKSLTGQVTHGPEQPKPNLEQTFYAQRRAAAAARTAPKVTQAFDAAPQRASPAALSGSVYAMSISSLPAFDQSAAAAGASYSGASRSLERRSFSEVASAVRASQRISENFRHARDEIGLSQLAERNYQAVLRAVKKRSDVEFFLMKALRPSLLFEAMPPDQLQACVDAMEPCHLKPREVALRVGEPSEYMYIVHKGRVAIQPGPGAESARVSHNNNSRGGGAAPRTSSAARELHCGPGEMFGEAGLMKGGRAELTAVATGMTQLWRLHRIAYKMIQISHTKRDKEMRLNLLRSVEVFQSMELADEEYHQLVAACDLANLADGATVMSQGDTDRMLYVVIEGHVGVYIGNRYVATFGPGDYFGEMSMLTGAPRAATIRAIGECKCLTLSGDAWDAVLGTHSEVLARNMRRRLLRGIPAIQTLAGGLSRIEERKLLAAFRFVSHGEGELVMRTGDPAEDLYLLEEGEVSVHSGGPSAQQHAQQAAAAPARGGSHGGSAGVGKEVARLGAGSWVGESAILEGARRQATVVAETRCRFAVISRRALLEAVRNDDHARELRDLFEMIKRDHETPDGTRTRHDSTARPTAHRHSQGALWKDLKEGTVYVPQNAPLANAPSSAVLGALEKTKAAKELAREGSHKHWMAMAKQVHDGAWRDNAEWRDKLMRHDLNFTKQQHASLSVLQQLGKGSFGKVELVLHPAHARLFALKRQQVKKLDVLMREEEAMSECRCGSVLGFFGSFIDDGASFMLTEYMAGGDLHQLLERRTTLPVAEARFYLACLLSAVEAMHTMDWIHRDLKLENVMIANNGYAKVIDLGLAKRIVDTYAFSMCGTPVYMAPEVIRGTGYAKPADLWSLGVMLAEMVGGHSPFWSPGREPTEVMALFQLILKSEPTHMTHAGFTIPCKELVRGLLHKKAHLRLGNHALLSEGITQLKHHDFFKGFDWHALNARRAQPPFVPTVPPEWAKLEADQLRISHSMSKLQKKIRARHNQ